MFTCQKKQVRCIGIIAVQNINFLIRDMIYLLKWFSLPLCCGHSDYGRWSEWSVSLGGGTGLLLLVTHQVVFDFLQPLGLQQARLPCPSLSPWVAQIHVHWIGDAIHHLILHCPLSSCPQSFLASVSFPMSQLFASGVQSIGASASVLAMNIQGLFTLGLTGLISLLFKGLPRVFPRTTIRKHQLFSVQPSLWLNSHIRTWLLEKP